jgi:hypothetical protein
MNEYSGSERLSPQRRGQRAKPRWVCDGLSAAGGWLRSRDLADATNASRRRAGRRGYWHCRQIHRHLTRRPLLPLFCKIATCVEDSNNNFHRVAAMSASPRQIRFSQQAMVAIRYPMTRVSNAQNNFNIKYAPARRAEALF